MVCMNFPVGEVSSGWVAAQLYGVLMLDFKCIISPYNAYAHDGNWVEGELDDATTARLNRSLAVLTELAERLESRSYISNWEI